MKTQVTSVHILILIYFFLIITYIFTNLSNVNSYGELIKLFISKSLSIGVIFPILSIIFYIWLFGLKGGQILKGIRKIIHRFISFLLILASVLPLWIQGVDAPLDSGTNFLFGTSLMLTLFFIILGNKEINSASYDAPPSPN